MRDQGRERLNESKCVGEAIENQRSIRRKSAPTNGFAYLPIEEWLLERVLA